MRQTKKTLAKGINDGDGDARTVFGWVYKYVKEKVNRFRRAQFKHKNITNNAAAHNLAKYANNAQNKIWMEETTQCILANVINNMRHD